MSYEELFINEDIEKELERIKLKIVLNNLGKEEYDKITKTIFDVRDYNEIINKNKIKYNI